MNYQIDESVKGQLRKFDWALRRHLAIVFSAFLFYAVLFTLKLKDLRPEYRLFALAGLALFVSKSIIRMILSWKKFGSIVIKIEIGPQFIVLTLPKFSFFRKEIPTRTTLLTLENLEVEEFIDDELELSLKLKQGKSAFLLPFKWFPDKELIRKDLTKVFTK